MPLEVFLPPDHFGNVHMLLSKDWNGVNNGVFFIRVHEWSVNLLSAAIAYPIVHPDIELFWPDQSALSNLLNENQIFARSVVYCPLRWFNAYMRSEDGRSQNEDSPAHFQVHPGDLLVHFPGTPREHLNHTLSPYLQIAQLHEAEWEPTLDKTDYVQETSKFWGTMHRQPYVPKPKSKPTPKPKAEVVQEPEVDLDPEEDEQEI
ncbi:galactosyl transferase GMA12/MNN10 family protein [Penicillium verhagenii]|uniref:galactosyl transferase GMA12/MNN10 family protein n=1 Tax=Penicillium verhagenii TaxID=1562060 RepID=UPI002545AC15|nr:galactosyl transferase GMA12/MNN10 family protein [Penicillium verhagenii]KAJ5918628.1 galactosyl transferase GMA12/MNN10 family protein [Penicillium verhagenii]